MQFWVEFFTNLFVITIMGGTCANLLSEAIKNKISSRQEGIAEQVSFNHPPRFQDRMIGRKKDIKKVRKKLKKNPCVWISSIGGLGKTTLAIVYARKYRYRYRQIYWMSWKGDLRQTLEDKVNVQLLSTMRKEEIYNRVVCFFQSRVRKSCLLIVDGLDDYTAEEIEIINSFRCKVLITSRRKSQSHIEHHLEELSDTECKKMFVYYAMTKISLEQLQTILKVTGKHTLCIKLLARYANAYSVEQLFQDIVWFNTSDLQHSVEIVDGEPNQQIVAYFTQIYHITCEQDKKRLLLNLSLLPADDLKISEINLLIGENVCSAIAELEKLGWLIRRERQSIYLHPILARTIRRISFNEEVKPSIYCDMLMNAENLTAISGDDFDVLDEKIEFLQYCDSIISNYQWEDTLMARLIINSVCIKLNMGEQNDWIMTKVEKAIEILKRAYEESPFQEECALQYARALTDLSECYYKISFEKAIGMEKEALEIKSKLADGYYQTLDLLKSYSNLMLYHHAGFMNDYIDVAEPIMLAYENEISNYKRVAANIYNHFGLLLRSNGRRKEGILYLEKALKIVAANKGQQHSMYPMLINTLGAMYAELLQNKEVNDTLDVRGIKQNALKYLYKAYLMKRKCNKRTSSVAVSLHNLATTWFLMNHKYLAWFYEYRALKIRMKTSDEELYLASSLLRMGSIYWKIYDSFRNKYHEVKGPRYLQQAQAIYKKHSEKDQNIDCSRELEECEKYLSYFACASRGKR